MTDVWIPFDWTSMDNVAAKVLDEPNSDACMLIGARDAEVGCEVWVLEESAAAVSET